MTSSDIILQLKFNDSVIITNYGDYVFLRLNDKKNLINEEKKSSKHGNIDKNERQK